MLSIYLNILARTSCSFQTPLRSITKMHLAPLVLAPLLALDPAALLARRRDKFLAMGRDLQA